MTSFFSWLVPLIELWFNPTKTGKKLLRSELFFSKQIKFSHLLESNVFGVLSEALSAQVQTIFADDTVVVGAGAAVKKTQKIIDSTWINFERL